MTSIVKPVRPWTQPGTSPLAERLRRAFAGLSERRHSLPGAPGAAESSPPAIAIAAALGATDAELVRLSRWHARPTADDVRWAAILATRYGGVLRQR